MAFAFLSENGFELGTLGHFDAETDTETRLDFPHYATLARVPGLAMPYRGAYCMRVNLANDGTPADAYVQETGSWDMTAGTNDIYLRLYFWVSSDITMATTNEFAILQFWSATSTVEAGVYINFTTANGLRLGIGEASASVFKPLTTGVWHCLEVFFDPAGSSAGTFDAWLDGSAFTQVASITNADITSGVVGVLGQDAGTTKGVILFDEIVADDARIFPIAYRWAHEILFTASGHAFVGPGLVKNVQLLSGAGTDCVVSLYDTDIGNTDDASKIKSELKNTANSQHVDPSDRRLRFDRGCYVALSGTTPRAIVSIERAPGHFSEGTIRSQGLHRNAHPLGA